MAEETVSCNYQASTCTNFTYGDWGICNTSGAQSRPILSSLPSNCIGGNPIINQTCNYNSGENLNKDLVMKQNNLSVSIDREIHRMNHRLSKYKMANKNKTKKNV